MRTPSNRWPSEIRSPLFSSAARLVLAVLPAMVSLVAGRGSPKAAPAVPSPEVEVASVVQKDVPIFSEWVATLDGYINAQIQPQAAGYVIRQTNKEGSFVRKGQILFQIDPRSFQAGPYAQSSGCRQETSAWRPHDRVARRLVIRPSPGVRVVEFGVHGLRHSAKDR